MSYAKLKADAMLSREQINNLNSNYKIADAQNTKTIHAALRCAEVRAMRDALDRFVRSMTIRPDGTRYCGACGEETGCGYEHDEECFVAPMEGSLAAYDKLIEGGRGDDQPKKKDT